MGSRQERPQSQPGHLLPVAAAHRVDSVLRHVSPRAPDGPDRAAAGQADEADAELLPQSYAEYRLEAGFFPYLGTIEVVAPWIRKLNKIINCQSIWDSQ